MEKLHRAVRSQIELRYGLSSLLNKTASKARFERVLAPEGSCREIPFIPSPHTNGGGLNCGRDGKH